MNGFLHTKNITIVRIANPAELTADKEFRYFVF